MTVTGLIFKDLHDRCIAALNATCKVVGCMIQPMLEILQRKIDACQKQASLASLLCKQATQNASGSCQLNC